MMFIFINMKGNPEEISAIFLKNSKKRIFLLFFAYSTINSNGYGVPEGLLMNVRRRLLR